jgi:hypothetical protein
MQLFEVGVNDIIERPGLIGRQLSARLNNERARVPAAASERLISSCALARSSPCYVAVSIASAMENLIERMLAKGEFVQSIDGLMGSSLKGRRPAHRREGDAVERMGP